MLLREHRDTASAEAFFTRALDRSAQAPSAIITDHHQPYVKAIQRTLPTAVHGTVGDQVEGLVEVRNERGIRVGDNWHNLSKFHPLDLPDRGTRVRLELDAKGFIKSLSVLDQAPAASSSTTRDGTITRLSVLKTAAAFLAQMGQVHEGVRSDHVIPLAERWLARVEQEGDDQ